MKHIIFALTGLLLAIPCYGGIIIVDDDWPADFNNIQDAIDYSANGDIIYVFPGTYTGTGNRDISFNGKAITVQSVDPLDSYIVSVTVIDCNDFDPRGGFIFDSGEDANSVLAGLTIIHGRGNDGGAIRCYYSSPTISYCVLTANRNARFAGGIYLYDSNLTITNCTITDNIGSGIYCTVYSCPVISNCTISGNTGWGIPSSSKGGGIFCESDSKPEIRNCLITGNPAVYGGGIYTHEDSSPRITGCTITGNSAKEYGGGVLHRSNRKLSVSNSIIWANADSGSEVLDAQIYEDGGGTVDVWFSCIQDGNSNDSNIPFNEFDCFNIDDDPCFVVPGAGYWDDNNTPQDSDDFWVWTEGDYHLRSGSPCIEAGNPYFTYGPDDADMDGQSRVMGQYVDIGADESEIAIIIVTKPAGGEVWAAGSTHKIEWDSYGITGTVDVSYSTNNGANWVPIDNTADSGSYSWLLPGVDSNECIVSVEPNIPEANAIFIESGVFTIKPYSAGPPIAAEWKSLGGDFDRSGLSDQNGPESGCLKWQFQTSAPVSAGATVADNNTIHIACEDGNLYTLDANDGSLLWSYEVNSPLLSWPTIGLDGSVYVGAENGTLYAIDVNGYLQWTHTTDGFIYSSPAVTDEGDVYICSEDGTIYALGPDGSELWEFETAGAGSASGAIFASPAIGAGGDVYIGSVYEPNLYALDSNDGSVKWVCHFSDACDPNFKGNWVFSSPVVATDGTIYQTLLYNGSKRYVDEEEIYRGFWYEAKLYAIDPNNGDIIWDSNMSDTAREREEIPGPNEEPESYWFEKYYVDTHEEGGQIPPYPFTETIVMGFGWARYYRVHNSSFSSSALGPDGTIYVSFNDPYLRAVDPNGTMKWVSRLGMVGGSTLAVGGDGLVYAASHDGYMSVITPDGEEVARFEGGGPLSFPVIASDGSLIVSDANNTVWAIWDGDCEGEVSVLHRIEDIDGSGGIDFIDFAWLAEDWMVSTFCNSDLFFYYVPQGETCDAEEVYVRGDVDRNLYNEMIDISMLADKWLSGD
ncbi:MAG: outer membrane protein assembly factor BamB family protein [Planctomycetota bacterium]|jgi:outer membrane protein assembly factor BamB